MRLAVIACRIFNRELSYLSSVSPNICHIYWLEQGLHTVPEKLSQRIQDQIAEIEVLQESLEPDRQYDAIVLGYGLCSNGIVGAGSKLLPVIAPKCDDCIALFLGSQQRYLDAFHSQSGIYWYNSAWVETGTQPCEQLWQRQYQTYAELYGEENAEYLAEFDRTWVKNYHVCGYITSPLAQIPDCRPFSKEAASYLGWEFKEFEGSLTYLTGLLSGNWDDKHFLICPKGRTITQSFDEQKIKVKC